MDKLGKIRRLNWKERPQVSKIVKFEGDLSKTIVDKVPQRREILWPEKTANIWRRHHWFPAK